MALVIEDRVLEYTNSVGTGNLIVSGAPAGFRTFASVCSVNDTFYGAVVAVDGSGSPTGDWEICYFSYLSPNTISRTIVLASSNGGNAINFSTGLKQVFIDLVAAQVKDTEAPTYSPRMIEWYGDARVFGYAGGTSSSTGARPNVTDGTLPSNVVGKLIFSDEFGGAGLDTTKWTDRFTHYNNARGANNYNVSGGTANMWMARSSAGAFEKTNCTFTTDTKFAFRYGYLETRCKMSRGHGHWPGFWTYSIVHNDSLHEEIDVMEAYMGSPSGGWGTSDLKANNYSMTLWDANVTRRGYLKLSDVLGYQNNPNMSDAYFTYGALWEPDGVTMYFNGRKVGKLFHQYNDHHSVLIQLWWEDAYGVPSDTPQDSTNATKFEYVRVWDLANGSTSIAYKPTTSVDPATPADSTSTGGQVARPAPTSFAAALQPSPPFTVDNEGTLGNTTAKQLAGSNGLHAAWTAQMAASQADIVMLQYGASDQAEGITVAAYKSNLTSLVNTARTEGKFVVLVTPPPVGNADLSTYATAVREVGTTLVAPVIDVYTFVNSLVTGTAGKTLFQLMPDGLHPNQSTYTLMGDYAATRFNDFVDPSPPNKKIAYMGDSVVYGWDGAQTTGARVATPAPLRTEQVLVGYTVTNYGRSGATVDWLLQGINSVPTGSLASWIASNNHYYVVLQYCLNDAKAYSTTVYRDKMIQAIQMLLNASRRVILEIPNPASYATDTYVQVMRDLATQFNLPIIDQRTYLQGVMTGGTTLLTLMPDNLHPSQATYDKIGQYAASVWTNLPIPAPTTT